MRKECSECGYIFDELSETVCPKCDTAYYGSQTQKRLYEADIAHHGEDWLEAQCKIDDAIDRALYEGFKGVKIIHGHGGYGHTSIIKNKAVPYLARYAENHRCKLVRDKFTEGAHIIYF